MAAFLSRQSPSLNPWLPRDLSDFEKHVIRVVENTRPIALRQWDQIPMVGEDLILQGKIIAPFLDGKSVAFVGDSDCASLTLALLAQAGHPCPSHMTVLDFDERLLTRIHSAAQSLGIGRLIDCRLYNVFDPVPADLRVSFDWFYINPPYGSQNCGESIVVFAERGLQLLGGDEGRGCIILPYDPLRTWTIAAWQRVQKFLFDEGCLIGNMVNNLHRYHLDDDVSLCSSLVIVDRYSVSSTMRDEHRFNGVKVDGYTPYFYGRSVSSPYPRYIRADGSEEHYQSDGGIYVVQQ